MLGLERPTRSFTNKSRRNFLLFPDIERSAPLAQKLAPAPVLNIGDIAEASEMLIPLRGWHFWYVARRCLFGEALELMPAPLRGWHFWWVLALA
jgi:hypothetical protein